MTECASRSTPLACGIAPILTESVYPSIHRLPMDRPARRTVVVSLLYAVLSIAFCSPLFARPAGLGVGDWNQPLFYYAEIIKNVVEYAQPPFWSPWYCGG